MGEGRSGRFRRGRRRTSEPDPTAEDAPCVPCGQQSGLRSFSLNADDLALDDDFVAELVPGIAHAIAGGEVVLFDPRRSKSTLLNPSAALIWASIDGVATLGSIIDDLTEETGVDRATIDADVRDTVARFIHGGIVEPHGPPEPAADGSGPGATGPDGDGHIGSAPDERARRRARRVEHVLARRQWCLTDIRRCAGASVSVRTDSAELGALLGPALEHLATADTPRTTVSIVERPGSRSSRRFRILRDSATHAFAATASDAFDVTFTLLNDIAINDSPGHLVLHAGAVERDDSIVVVAGPSGRGKSTLTAALVQRGFAYLTDEVVAVDPETLGVLPYPKPFDLDRSSAGLLGIDPGRADGAKGKVAIEQLGEVATGAGRVRLMVLLGEPATAAPAPPSPAEQLIELLANTFASTFEPGTAPPDPLGALATLDQRVRIVHLERRSVEDACRIVDEQLRSIDLAPRR